ncbi:hypothetical protein AVEN_88883-1 [Araneus ventricosus]|uniref:Uncharacterized protein n=1 Tax=Araneus ventricosus TaxID=182803 RepID=A0A4Y2MEG3_ARAVE|nr:hypothetical protein AVEN_88883-1 [Araneus ventricosus]
MRPATLSGTWILGPRFVSRVAQLLCDVSADSYHGLNCPFMRDPLSLFDSFLSRPLEGSDDRCGYSNSMRLRYFRSDGGIPPVGAVGPWQVMAITTLLSVPVVLSRRASFYWPRMRRQDGATRFWLP